MKLGYASRSITPTPGLTLSGFASRCNAPSTGVSDEILVRAAALQGDGAGVLLLSFDLLALGPELDGQIHDALDRVANGLADRDHRLFVCTHTHSAPAAITLLGCGVPDAGYWRLVVAMAVEAAVEASRTGIEAGLRLAQITLPGSNYNRHAVLDDGRVVMSQFPEGKVVRRGPSQETMHLLRFEDQDGKMLLTLLSWAAHPCTLGGLEVSGDYPGMLCSKLARSWGMPVMFLQGACGDLNPPFSKMNRVEMTTNCDAILGRMNDLHFSPRLGDSPFSFTKGCIDLPYRAEPGRAAIARFHEGMADLARTGSGPAATRAVLANILNVEPGKDADPKLTRHVADCMRIWSEKLLFDDEGKLPASCKLALAVLRIGSLVLCSIAAEVFAETAIALQAENPDDLVLVLGYASPLVGYLPTAQCQAEGGYEADFAYRFYNHPAQFIPESEEMVRRKVSAAIRSSGQRFT